MSKVLVLRTCGKDGKSFEGFQWPLEVGVVVTAPDWVPIPVCGQGLHGALWGEGEGGLFRWDESAIWLVVAVKENQIVDLDGKVKFPACIIKHVGDQKSATDYIIANGAQGRAVIGCALTGGYRSTLTGGDGSTLTGGDWSTLTGGYWSTLTGGRRSTLTGGYWSTLTGGYGSTLTGGDESVLIFKYWDGERIRIKIAYVGEDGIKPNTPYHLNNKFEITEAILD